MDRETVIALAREAGIPIETDWAGRPSTLVIKDGGTYLRGIDDLKRFAALVAAAEREECAKVAESYEPMCDTCPSGVATAIRSRT